MLCSEGMPDNSARASRTPAAHKDSRCPGSDIDLQGDSNQILPNSVAEATDICKKTAKSCQLQPPATRRACLG